MSNVIYIFGYGKFGKSVYKALSKFDYTIKIKVVVQDIYNEAVNDGLDVELYDMYDDESIKSLGLESVDRVICAMDNNHKNLFLTLSIRELYPKLYIMGLSNSIHLTDKLKMAGANRVIDTYGLSGLMIKNVLLKPASSEFLQGFINNSHGLIFKEFTITKESDLDGKMVSTIDFDSYNIIFIGMVDLEKGKNFIFTTAGQEHKIDEDDILLLVGKEENIDKFIKAHGG